jgi:hypothetical protein
MGGGMGWMTGLGFKAEICDNWAVFSTGEIPSMHTALHLAIGTRR